MMILFSTSLTVLARDAQAPDMALLEFIGDSVSAGDELVDPMDWQSMRATPITQDTSSSANGADSASQQGHTKAQTQVQPQVDKRKSGR